MPPYWQCVRRTKSFSVRRGSVPSRAHFWWQNLGRPQDHGTEQVEEGGPERKEAAEPLRGPDTQIQPLKGGKVGALAQAECPFHGGHLPLLPLAVTCCCPPVSGCSQSQGDKGPAPATTSLSSRPGPRHREAPQLRQRRAPSGNN